MAPKLTLLLLAALSPAQAARGSDEVLFLQTQLHTSEPANGTGLASDEECGPLSPVPQHSVNFYKPVTILAFWSVSSKPCPMRLVQRNIEYLRAFERRSRNVRFDVFLAHYDQGKEGWFKAFGFPWYTENVNFSREEPGIKFWLAREYLAHHPFKSFNASSYAWLWFMDEDGDLTQMDLGTLITDAEASGSMIVTPAIVSVNRTTQVPEGQEEPVVVDAGKPLPAAVEAWGQADPVEAGPGNASLSIVKLHRTWESLACQIGDEKCKFQKPRGQCKLRHTNFIEVMFPMMRPEAFAVLAKYPAIGQKSIWGLDHVWCRLAGTVLLKKTWSHKVCAILDRAPVVHRDYATLLKHKDSHAGWMANRAQIQYMHAVFRMLFVERITEYDCVAPKSSTVELNRHRK